MALIFLCVVSALISIWRDSSWYPSGTLSSRFCHRGRYHGHNCRFTWYVVFFVGSLIMPLFFVSVFCFTMVGRWTFRFRLHSPDHRILDVGFGRSLVTRWHWWCFHRWRPLWCVGVVTRIGLFGEAVSVSDFLVCLEQCGFCCCFRLAPSSSLVLTVLYMTCLLFVTMLLYGMFWRVGRNTASHYVLSTKTCRAVLYSVYVIKLFRYGVDRSSYGLDKCIPWRSLTMVSAACRISRLSHFIV